MEQAREAVPEKSRIVIGLAHTKRECWVPASFEPGDAAESKTVHALRAELGFDPCERAEELAAIHDTDKRSAKRVLRLLTGGDSDREVQCWHGADLQTLRDRGSQTGLAAYFEELSGRLVPLFAGRQPRPQ